MFKTALSAKGISTAMLAGSRVRAIPTAVAGPVITTGSGIAAVAAVVFSGMAIQTNGRRVILRRPQEMIPQVSS
jgi:hypothetical protein